MGDGMGGSNGGGKVLGSPGGPRHLLVRANSLRLPVVSGSVHAVICSPPYFNLRRYEIPPTYWPRADYIPMPGLPPVAVPPMTCCLGNEERLDWFIGHLMLVLDECWRVCRSDSVSWWNLGDGFSSGNSGLMSGGKNGSFHGGSDSANRNPGNQPLKMNPYLKPLDLMGVPWRFAFAAQARGWTLRAAPPWIKPGSAMPECLDPKTKVFIRRGGWISRVTLQQLSELPELPEILSPTGWVQVKQVWKTRKPAMVLQVAKVERVICSADHRFPVSSDRRRTKTTIKRLEDIRHQGYTDYLLYCPIDRFLEGGMVTWMGRTLDYAFGYLLGVYIAEGGHDCQRSYRIKLTIGTHEDEFTGKIRESLSGLGLESKEYVYPESHARQFQVTSEWFSRTVDSFVFGNAKTKALNIELILNTPRSFRKGLLDGYIDGDGSDRGHIGWVARTASSRLRTDISTLASSVGIITSKGTVQINKSPRSDNMTESHGLWTPFIQRRKEKKGMDGVYQIPPRSKRPLYGLLHDERDMIDIEVEGGVFLIGDGLVTHNSCTSRPNTAHEMIFMLTKTSNYYFDMCAIRRPIATTAEQARSKWAARRNGTGKGQQEGVYHSSRTVAPFANDPNPAGRHYRTSDTFLDSLDSAIAFHADRLAELEAARAKGGLLGAEGGEGLGAFLVNPASYAGSHYAAWPQKLVQEMIRCSTSEVGVCSRCGSPWERVVEREGEILQTDRRRHLATAQVERSTMDGGTARSTLGAGRGGDAPAVATRTIGWRPTCSCPAGTSVNRPIILDPFGGSGTTAQVATSLGRHAISVDLSKDYHQLASDRVDRPHKPTARRPRPGRPAATLPGFGDDDEE